MNYKNFSKMVEIPIKLYTKDDIPIMDRVIEILLINMYGEAGREGAVYIGKFNYDEEESKICYMIASIIRSMYNRPIYVECAGHKFLKFLCQTRQLFKKGRARRISKTDKSIRSANDWINDILKANNLSDEYIFKIWEYLNEK